jgi:hypothetical protein
MRNKETNEIVEYRMSYTVLDKFLEDNPQLERYHTSENLPIMSDASRMSVPGLRKADSGFEKNVIARIREKVPGNTLSGHKTSGHNISEY